MRKLILAILMSGCVSALHADEKKLNLDKQGIAIQGYDPVAYFTQNKPVQGNPKFLSRYQGATYYFASGEDKATFDANPTKYEPSFGGFCAYGVSRNKLVEIDVEAFQIVDGRLLLQYSKGVQKDFNKDTKGNLTKADMNWSALSERKSK
jgi:YHS domain-containing protein